MSMRAHLLAMAILLTCTGAAPPISNVPPSADSDVRLTDGRSLHARELPLARMDGVILDDASFDSSGTRVAFIATFPVGAVNGDWRRTNPTQAYVADVASRTLTELSSDGRATGIAWRGENHVVVVDGGITSTIAIASAQKPFREYSVVDAIAPSTIGDLVSPPDEFRLQVLKTSSTSYAIGQVGAVRLRTIALARNHMCALVGKFVVWIDGAKDGGPPISRDGPDTILMPSFGGSAYGDSLTPVIPLGHVVYQGAYRNGVAYFAFSFGLQRIVAATRDFVSFFFPKLPSQPEFTVGDGMGAGADGSLYLVNPVDLTAQVWRGNRYVSSALRFPDSATDEHRLLAAMTRLSARDALEPPLRPDADALDAALLEWRIYPIGDATGDRWVASYLGRAFVAGSDGRFKEIAEPGFPFAVLGRTDDGRIWGAVPRSRRGNGAAIVDESSQVLSSRDGERWNVVATLTGGPGAVGLHAGATWIAMTRHESDANGVELVRLTDTMPDAAPTGAIYAGEDMFFAETGVGWYLVCGGEPGTRADDGSGPLVALKLDAARLFRRDTLGMNEYVSDRIDPLHLSSQPTSSEISPFVEPSATSLIGMQPPYLGTLVTDAPAFLPHCCRSLSPDAERQFEVEYAWRPYPLARVSVAIAGNTATVQRSLERGQLSASGQKERWTRDQTGQWVLSRVTSRWKI
jgi:hypothetical protein